jgi:hypothetical protein
MSSDELTSNPWSAMHFTKAGGSSAEELGAGLGLEGVGDGVGASLALLSPPPHAAIGTEAAMRIEDMRRL